MSNLGKIMAMTGIMAAMAEQNQYGISHNRNVYISANPEPEWKRKKCKTCQNCGSNCNPYNYKGHILKRFSKPNYNACEKYTIRKK